jgi:hypothetical protein
MAEMISSQFTSPPEDQDPPPSGAVSAWFLYITTLASFIYTTYLFTIQPCVRRSKSKKLSSNDASHLQAGTMPNSIVLPIFSSSHAYDAVGGKKVCLGRRRIRGRDI